MEVEAIRAIEQYIYELEQFQLGKTIMAIKHSSYSIWAAYEVLRYVKLRNDITPYYAIEEFMKKMNNFACMNPKNSYMFSVAYDIAADIQNYILCVS